MKLKKFMFASLVTVATLSLVACGSGDKGVRQTVRRMKLVIK